jgi:hypothetical protein
VEFQEQGFAGFAVKYLGIVKHDQITGGDLGHIGEFKGFGPAEFSDVGVLALDGCGGRAESVLFQP